jgi:hypothetical protein
MLIECPGYKYFGLLRDILNIPMDSRDFHFPDHLVESGVLGTGFTGNVYSAADTRSGQLVSGRRLSVHEFL